MPEYSSTTLTPTNETKVPAMQNNNSGNFQLDALKAYILAEKAQANGLASLDATGKLVSSQIPDNLDDVLVYGSYALLPATGVEGKIYITADTNSMYRWDASLETPDYVMLAVDLEEYATKAELQAETNQRKASDSRLESRLENLEQKAGDYTTVQYRGTDAVPTGKAKYGLVKNFVGKSRAWNQLCQNGNFTSTNNWTGTRCTISASDNVLSGNITAVVDSGFSNRIAQSVSFASGHKILILVGFYAVHSGELMFRIKGDVDQDATASVVTGWNYINVIASTPSNTNAIYIGINGGRDGYSVGEIIKYRNCNFYDLTLIFGSGNEPSTVADAIAQLPALGQYNAYDAGALPSTVISGVEVVGFNRFDKTKSSAYFLTSTGEQNPSVDKCCSDYMPILPNTAYYMKAPAAIPSQFTFHWFDANKNWLGRTGGGIVNAYYTSPSNALYCRINYMKAYEDEVCFNLSQTNTSISPHNGDHIPYKTHTLSLSETVTLKSAGSVADTDELNVEVLVDGVKVNKRRKTTRVGSVDLGSLDWTYDSEYARFTATISPSMKLASVRTLDFVCGKYQTTKVASIADVPDKSVYNGNNSSEIFIHDSAYTDATTFKASLSGIYLNYELATPVVTLLDPITDNFIEVEGGGTIETVQEQTPVIDNCLDVGYLTL